MCMSFQEMLEKREYDGENFRTICSQLERRICYSFYCGVLASLLKKLVNHL